MTPDPLYLRPAPLNAPWMGLVEQAWQAVYPDGKPPVQTARQLRPLVDRIGIAAVIERLTVYLARTEARFINLASFASTSDAYIANPSPPPEMAQQTGTTQQLTPEELRRIYGPSVPPAGRDPFGDG